ncbi:MAG: UvrD-helicase domain-containing protein [Chloroflexota bacterium]|nr:UvrD-helicase domain-containing protein [Chloroflexota bacterium]MDE2960217.1 UvrD-helicase domain-containing protein [Chloroflexota bacterium]
MALEHATAPSNRLSGFVPVDDDARKTIRDDLGATLFVEASAGTGKTTSLVQRVTNLVATGTTTLDRIAAITFTEAAAAELRDRIRAELEKASGDDQREQVERDRCYQGIADLDQADISTLHSFAGGLLRERPLEAGLPPSFETSDEILAGIKFEEEWRDWLDRHLDGETELAPQLALALILGLTLNHLRTIARAFHQNYSDLSDVDFLAPDNQPAAAVETILDAAPEMERLCAYSRNGDADPLYVHVRSRLDVIGNRPAAATGLADDYRFLLRVLPLRQSRGRQSDWNTDPYTGRNAGAALKDILSELDGQADEEIQNARRAALMPILEDLRQTALDYARKRRAEGRAEFHDLLVWARELLRDNPGVRDYFRNRYTHLLIDEAQDTDPIQAEIAMLLAGPAHAVTSDEDQAIPWDQVRPEPGKLFVVGDPKQSIYRFRRADVGQMKRLQSSMERSGGRTVKLVQNFRSQQPVIGWVNHLFEQWMAAPHADGDDDGDSQAGYDAMSALWVGDTGNAYCPRVWTLGNAAVEAPIGEIRQAEAREIGLLLRQMVAEQWETLDQPATGSNGRETYRPVRHSDVCILMPRRTGLAALERGLEAADIPFRLESASLVFETQEIRDLLNCLKAIDDPADQVATVAALRSPAFGCSDADLLRHRARGGSFDYLSNAAPDRGDDVTLDAFSVLRSFHRARLDESTGALIDRFVRERELMESAVGHPRMREQWRRYRFLVEQAGQFGRAGGGTLRAFLQWVDDQIREGARVTESPVPETDEDAVRVMTIHGSKGLEFPVVILAGINSAPARGGNSVIVDRGSGRVEVGIGPAATRFATPGFEELVEIDNRMSAEEHIRLMYVATTRARDHLVLSLRRPSRGARTTAAMIAEYLENRDDLWEAVELNGVSTPAETQTSNTDHQPHIIDETLHSTEHLDQWAADRKRTIEGFSRPQFVAATALNRAYRDEEEEPESPEPWRRGRAGTSVGRAVHAVLQSIDLATGAGVEHRARAQAVAEGVPDREAEVSRLVEVAVQSGVVRRAVASQRIWREVPVAAPVGDGSLHGFIDLLFEEENELVVVDYKTDAVTEAQLPEVVDRYRLQGGAYAHAISQITGKTVKEVVFLYLQPKMEVVLPNLPGAMADARAAAQSLLQSPG